MKKEKYKVPPTYLFPVEQGSDLAPFSVTRIGCQGFIGPVPPPFFISLCNELVAKVRLISKLKEIRVLLSVKKFLHGFYFAFKGMRFMLSERNFQVELIIFLIVISSGIYFNISKTEWFAVLMVSAIVLGLEAMNTAIEKLCDLYSLEKNPTIEKIKDISAGAVLISSLIAASIGILVFYPYFFG